MVSDVVFVLNTADDQLSYAAKYSVLKQATWAWTEYNGKYEGCEYWSVKDKQEYKENPKAEKRHEHIVPKQIVIKKLMKLENPTSDIVKKMMERLLLGVVVTLEEDKALNKKYRRKMPPKLDISADPENLDPWLRYKECGIEVKRTQACS